MAVIGSEGGAESLAIPSEARMLVSSRNLNSAPPEFRSPAWRLDNRQVANGKDRRRDRAGNSIGFHPRRPGLALRVHTIGPSTSPPRQYAASPPTCGDKRGRCRRVCVEGPQHESASLCVHQKALYRVVVKIDGRLPRHLKRVKPSRPSLCLTPPPGPGGELRGSCEPAARCPLFHSSCLEPIIGPDYKLGH